MQGEVAMGLQADWKKAKTDFEKTTKKKKPDTGFFSHATGIDAAFAALDGVIEKEDFAAAKTALATVEKKSDAYSIILAKTAASPNVKAGDYVAEVKKLDAALASIVKKARIEVKNLDAAAIAKAQAEAKANREPPETPPQRPHGGGFWLWSLSAGAAEAISAARLPLPGRREAGFPASGHHAGALLLSNQHQRFML